MHVWTAGPDCTWIATWYLSQEETDAETDGQTDAEAYTQASRAHTDGEIGTAAGLTCEIEECNIE